MFAWCALFRRGVLLGTSEMINFCRERSRLYKSKNMYGVVRRVRKR